MIVIYLSFTFSVHILASVRLQEIVTRLLSFVKMSYFHTVFFGN